MARLKWYYVTGGESTGPVSARDLQSLFDSGRLGPDTLVWNPRMSDWTSASRTGEFAFPSRAPQSEAPRPSPPAPPHRMGSYAGDYSGWGAGVYLETRISKPLYLAAYIAMGVGSWLFGFSYVMWLFDGGTTASWLMVLGVAVGIAGLVFLMRFWYKAWSMIQDGYARTTPGKAVGFLFIPFFSLYWVFQAFWGFSVDLNRYIARHGLRVRSVNQGLFLTIPILALVSLVPGVVGIVAGIAGFIVYIIAIVTLCDTLNDPEFVPTEW